MKSEFYLLHRTPIEEYVGSSNFEYTCWINTDLEMISTLKIPIISLLVRKIHLIKRTAKYHLHCKNGHVVSRFGTHSHDQDQL